jgi:hypothetical protein
MWRWHLVDALAAGTLQGVRTDWDRLQQDSGSGEALAEQILGRPLDPAEQRLTRRGQVPGRILAAPAYQGA